MIIVTQNCRGHTLVELLIAMLLSLLIFAAIIPINGLGLKAAQHQQKIIGIVNQLRQSLKQFETDIKSAALTGCLLNKSNIRDLTFTQPTSINNRLSSPWLAGNHNGSWHPESPFFDSANIKSESDAINLIFAVLNDELNLNNLNSQPNRVFYITNCTVAEITRGVNSTLSTANNSQIYPLQSTIYYVREINEKLILYRQYLTKSGKPRNEPLIDNIESLKIGYGEETDADTLVFRTANKVEAWNNIVVIYIRLKISIDNNSYSISRLVELSNIYD